MQEVNQSEVQFIIDSIEEHVRMDTRELTQKRQLTIIDPCPFASALADKAIRIIRGHSEMSLSISFRSSFETLYELNIVSENRESLLSKDDFKTLKSSISHPNPCFNVIESFLNTFKIGCVIEAEIIKDDGSLLEMFFTGLKHIFSSLLIPDIHNLSMSIKAGVELPTCTSFAFIKSKSVTDPTLIEEKSSDCLIYIFEGPEKAMLAFGSVDYSKLHQLLLL
ncbi:hypothetical protein GINT2_000325 [Glugoides intestinalis]